MHAHSDPHQNANLIEIITTINTHVKALCSGRSLSRDDRYKLSSAMISLKLDHTRFDLHLLIHSKHPALCEDTINYISANFGDHQSVYSRMSKKQVNVDIVIKGFIDGGDLSPAERLVKYGYITLNDLCRVYHAEGKHHRAELAKDSREIMQLIRGIKFNRHNKRCHDNDNTDHLVDTLRKLIGKYAGIDCPNNLKRYARFIELRQVYNNINPHNHHNLIYCAQLKEDLASVDPECLMILANAPLMNEPADMTSGNKSKFL